MIVQLHAYADAVMAQAAYEALTACPEERRAWAEAQARALLGYAASEGLTTLPTEMHSDRQPSASE